MSQRTELLKRNLCYKPALAKRYKKVGDFKYATEPIPEHNPGVKVCIERARYLTKSYKATEGEPMVIRRAKALKHILENMTIWIGDGELIVGNFASTLQSLSIYPEIIHRWLTKALDDGYRDALDEDGKKEYKQMIAYWQGNSVDEKVLNAVKPELKDYIYFNGLSSINEFGFGGALEILNTKRLLELGLRGIMGQVEQKLKELDEGYYEKGEIHASDYMERRYNYQAMLIALQAGIDFSKRYAALAREKANKEKDEKRKGELLQIAEVCDWVPENPARTFHEALQSYFLCELISRDIEVDGQGLGDRFDVLLNPYYQKDKAEGRITREEAQELVECFLVKQAESSHLKSPQGATLFSGVSKLKCVNIGGVLPNGDDATNELSFIVLDAAEVARLPEPSIALRYHPKINQELILKAIDVIHTGVGYPAIYNDSAMIPFLLGRGIPLEEARNWGITACVILSVPGKCVHSQRPNYGVINLAKCLELALYQGKDKDSFSGKQLGPKTPDPKAFTCIEDVMEAYLTQVNSIAHKVVQIDNIAQTFYSQELQRPFTSALLDDSLEQGKDCVSISYNSITNTLFCGTTNVANSLAAIKKFVFDDKQLTMEELIEACRTNFEGQEELRQRLINEAPKFGNDDDYVDLLAREVHIRSNEEFMKYKDYWGFPLILDGSIAGGYYGYSTGCGALPDGKKDSAPLADAVISPSAGTDKRGPTAVLKSVSKITPTYANLFNQKFMPQFLEGENKKLFAQYLKTWCDLGMYHIQFNVMNKEMLLDAQDHPEKYPNLVVRVAGYSAYWADLSKPIQDDIIRRTEQKL